MSKLALVFSPRASERLAQIASHLSEQGLSNAFIVDYLNQFELWLNKVLLEFPDSGIPMPEFGADIRKICYKKYSFVYRVTAIQIEILSVYRENLP
ncbi:type II toxin-antitoxin system RelE/ParE family toxin [Rheinheimera muenzenbergensis]|uniref:Type II toxin-antitoxin system RelE/ParE family toxin n=1 Tax=Rheinheimera muenzenbergensis TaxID=1193628 RepID=A0ABU8C2M2_9GAMM|nr:type II toxin-antitoxin system RelE/ParE family toxin [Gammaproteobacteria bacterium]MBU1556428.1 type II toxin-antitoxin system RelE/ParE family toxin [Gammaproteobacteria bacterium]MBU2071988.1 type II toxin-antitoxin system RelE/ParE family toxin [Gammaproteobacteria bacterium]MBU2183927.1 type II toxin-antitoxin system RelE/ParE family toxin [Gammaproteobacteria bacterium]MBU2203319.1 type II toxin-antitoxin system RelE/ParE family toxin [Gammaproteobacteria bacterium]